MLYIAAQIAANPALLGNEGAASFATPAAAVHEVVARWADRAAVLTEAAHGVRVIRGVPARAGRGERGKGGRAVMVPVASATLATDHDGMGPAQSRRVTIRHGTDRITEVTVLSTDPAVGEIAEPDAPKSHNRGN